MHTEPECQSWGQCGPCECLFRILFFISSRLDCLCCQNSILHLCSFSFLSCLRPLWVDYPKETATFTIDDEFLIGEKKKKVISQYVIYKGLFGKVCFCFLLFRKGFVGSPSHRGRVSWSHSLSSWSRRGNVDVKTYWYQNLSLLRWQKYWWLLQSGWYVHYVQKKMSPYLPPASQ